MIYLRLHKLGPICVILALVLMAAGPQAAEQDTSSDESEVETATGVDYDVEFDVPDIDGIGDLIEQSSQLVSLADNPPASLAGLRRRSEADVERFESVMKSFGYYDSSVSYDLSADVDPVVVTVTVEPGQQYVLAAFDIAYLGGATGS